LATPALTDLTSAVTLVGNMLRQLSGNLRSGASPVRLELSRGIQTSSKGGNAGSKGSQKASKGGRPQQRRPPRSPEVRGAFWMVNRVRKLYPWAWYTPRQIDTAFIESAQSGRTNLDKWWGEVPKKFVKQNANAKTKSADINTEVLDSAFFLQLQARARRWALIAAMEGGSKQDFKRALRACLRLHSYAPGESNTKRTLDEAQFHLLKTVPGKAIEFIEYRKVHNKAPSDGMYTSAISAVVAAEDTVMQNVDLPGLKNGASDANVAKHAVEQWQALPEVGGRDFDIGKIIKKIPVAEQKRMAIIANVLQKRKEAQGLGRPLDLPPVEWVPVLALLNRCDHVGTMDLIDFYLKVTASTLNIDVLSTLDAGLARRQFDATRSRAYIMVYTMSRLESDWSVEKQIADDSMPVQRTPLQVASIVNNLYFSACRTLFNYFPTSSGGRESKMELISDLDAAMISSKYLKLLPTQTRSQQRSGSKAAPKLTQEAAPSLSKSMVKDSTLVFEKSKNSSDLEFSQLDNVPTPLIAMLLRCYVSLGSGIHDSLIACDRLQELAEMTQLHPNLNWGVKDFLAALNTLTNYVYNRVELVDRLDTWISNSGPEISVEDPQVCNSAIRLVRSAALQQGKRLARNSLLGKQEEADLMLKWCEIMHEATRLWYTRMCKAVQAGKMQNAAALELLDESQRHTLEALVGLGYRQDAESFIEKELGGMHDTYVFNALLLYHSVFTGDRQEAVKLIADMQSAQCVPDAQTLTSFSKVFLGSSDDVYIGDGFTGNGAPVEMVRECIGHILPLAHTYNIKPTRACVQRLIWNCKRVGLTYEYEKVKKLAAKHNVKFYDTPYRDPADSQAPSY